MLAGVAEKFSFGIAAVASFSLRRLSDSLIWAAMNDIVFGILFVVASILTRRRQDV
ncbi:hypothetical protein [Leptolyngbya sp. 7M]|uniref:hypothetical protein n=1 Tax=Leptolyngbya sp. 7M TaxID=2812896 RepID=UPI001B8CFF99|nr:hypothetical protein [Leptolyngbya sp. 7M]QYO66061.1 hypothetical protein JVX88_04470 [Leptolyngbya sp. 7M]